MLHVDAESPDRHIRRLTRCGPTMIPAAVLRLAAHSASALDREGKLPVRAVYPVAAKGLLVASSPSHPRIARKDPVSEIARNSPTLTTKRLPIDWKAPPGHSLWRPCLCHPTHPQGEANSRTYPRALH